MAATEASRTRELHRMNVNTEELRKWAPLGAAGVLGLAAAGIGWTLISSGSSNDVAVEAATALDEVVVAARALPPGHVLTAEDLMISRVEEGSLPAAAHVDYATLLAVGEDEMPRVIRVLVPQGVAVTDQHLAPLGSTGGLTSILPQGRRAMTISLSPEAGLNGMLRPGDRVDVVVTIGSGGQPTVRTVAQDLRVLAVNGRMIDTPNDAEDGGDPYAEVEDQQVARITFEVSFEQAARIDLAASNGSPRLVLRNDSDRELSPFEGLTLGEFSGTVADKIEGVIDDEWFAGDDIEIEPFDPMETATPGVIENPTGIDNTSLAGADQSDLFGPTSAPPAGVETAETKPTPRRVRKPRPHVVEVIRGGVASRESLPAAGSNKPAPSHDEDPFD